MEDSRSIVETHCASVVWPRTPTTELVQTARYEPVIEPTSEADRLRRRLKTFSQWISKKSSLQLATAGFIYTGITDKVECQTCGIRLYNWQEDEDPLQAHKKYAPDCEFMLKNFPNVQAPPRPKKILTVKYPQYSNYETRLKSFDSWPLKCVAQKPEMMARSGFFYIGSADRARCFHCGVTLRDWDMDDYPPCVHRQCSGNCPFVNQLNIDAMVTEIEHSKREAELSVVESRDPDPDRSVLVRCTSVPTEDMEITLRPTNHTDSSASLPLSPMPPDACQQESVLLERTHRIRISPGEKIEVNLRGDGGLPTCVLLIERNDEKNSAEE